MLKTYISDFIMRYMHTSAAYCDNNYSRFSFFFVTFRSSNHVTPHPLYFIITSQYEVCFKVLFRFLFSVFFDFITNHFASTMFFLFLL